MSPSDCVLCYLRMSREPFERDRFRFLVNVFGEKRAIERFDEDYDFFHTDDFHDRVIERVDPKYHRTFAESLRARRRDAKWANRS